MKPLKKKGHTLVDWLAIALIVFMGGFLLVMVGAFIAGW